MDNLDGAAITRRRSQGQAKEQSDLVGLGPQGQELSTKVMLVPKWG